MRTVPQRLNQLIEPVVTGLGYEFVGAEIDTPPGRRILRVYIDSEEGIMLDDCSRVSHQLHGMLEVEDPVADDYDLEVSSPGLDRPLFSKAHFLRFVGEKAEIKLIEAIEGSKNFRCTLLGMQDEDIIVERDGVEYRLPFSKVRKARLIPELNKPNKGRQHGE